LQLEGRGSTSGWNHHVQGFAAVHRGFISLTPSASFAPISHAGQVLQFEANDAFRTGADGTVSWRKDRQAWTAEGSVLGQWDVRTGLGLPFTTPAQVRLAWERNVARGSQVELSARGLAPARLTARNEAPTPGALLVDIHLRQTSRRGQWSLDVQNVFNSAWLDHISAYRALGLAAQGRWVQVQFSTTLKHNTTKTQS
jgi:iron complex outermembrane receptor protein